MTGIPQPEEESHRRCSGVLLGVLGAHEEKHRRKDDSQVYDEVVPVGAEAPRVRQLVGHEI